MFSVSYVNYGRRVTDLEGVRRAAELTAELRSRNVSARRGARTIALRSGVRDPYTGKPFNWDGRGCRRIHRARARRTRASRIQVLNASGSRSLAEPLTRARGQARVIKTAPGHTPGHQMLFLKLRNFGPLLLMGDLYHLPEEKTLDRVPTFDFDAAMTRATRKRWMRSSSSPARRRGSSTTRRRTRR